MASLPDEIEGALASDISVLYNPYQVYAATALQQNILRKLIPKDCFDADVAAEYSFHEANAKCAKFRFTEMWEIDRVVVGETRKLLDSFFHPRGGLLVEGFDDLFYNGRLGPGVSVGSPNTSLYGKLWGSDLTGTSQLICDEYLTRVRALPLWSNAESHRSDQFGSPSLVQGSRTIFVPKTSATSRMICAEPTLNMFFQLGFARLLEARLRSFFGIDLALQPAVNRTLAGVGSVSGCYSTIDLTSASDSISIDWCKRMLPDWVFDLICMLRSPSTQIGSDTIPLHMISTMGCGFTFPLQTIIFAAISKACQNIFGLPGEAHLTAVFGDDIVCPSWAHDKVIKYLQFFGFTPNASKTFSVGAFRESCGADWFYGQPVRPVFIRSLDSPQDRVVAINALNEWTAYTGIPLVGTVTVLLSSLPQRFRNRIPREGAKDAGIRVPYSMSNTKNDRNGSRRFVSWEPRSVGVRFTDDENIISEGHPAVRYLKYNPDGLYLSCIFGEVKGMFLALRHKSQRYRAKRRVSPNWGNAPAEPVNGIRICGQQWETAVERNLINSL
jgi:hypothetical protein